MAREFQDNPNLLKELAADEKIVWKGAPEDFPLMTEETKKGLTKRWLISIAAAVVLTVCYLLVALGTEQGMSIWVLVIVLVALAYYAFLPAVDRGNVLKKCRYYVTDRRVLLYYADREAFCLPLAGLKSEVSPAEEGCVHVDLGSCVGLKGKKRRVAAFVPKKDDDNNVCGFVMYNVADSQELRAALGI